jgi:hypothetical protein
MFRLDLSRNQSMGRARLLKEAIAPRGGCRAHDPVADAPLSIVGLHCDMTDVFAAARQCGRKEHAVRR